jgi:hypothetical protein
MLSVELQLMLISLFHLETTQQKDITLQLPLITGLELISQT